MDIITLLRNEVDSGPRGCIVRISDACGVPVKTLRNLYYGVTANPKLGTVAPLAAYLKRRRALTRRR